jgi:hypothetical protein
MKKTAGLPMWGWVALAAAGGIAALVWFQRPKAPAAATPPTLAVDTTDSSSDQNAALLAQIRDLQGATSTPTTTKPATNDEWRRAAIEWINTAPNFAGTTPILAQIAITDYLAGKPIRGTWEDWTITAIMTGIGHDGKKIAPGIGAPPDPPNTPYQA